MTAQWRSRRPGSSTGPGITRSIGLPAPIPVVRAFAHLVVQAPAVARGGDPRDQVDVHFTLLSTGWDAQAAGLGRD